MYQRLTDLDVAAVERGLAAGMRHAEIAREFDLSVWTIARIADRRRFDRDENAPTTEELPEDDGPPDYQARNHQRCPTCGAMIYVTPCIACRLATAVPANVAVEEPEEETTNDTKYTNKSGRNIKFRVRNTQRKTA